MTLRRLFIRYATPTIWKNRPRRQIVALHEFAQIEKDSGCQLLHCLPFVASPALKADLIQHTLEEFYHGDIFLNCAKKMSPDFRTQDLSAKEDLLKDVRTENDLIDFFAYVHIGERNINRDFLAYSAGVSDPKLKQVFLRAGMDEGHHEDSTDSILSGLCPDRSVQQWALLKAGLLRQWKTYKQKMSFIGRLKLGILLSLTYFLFGPFVKGSFKRRLEMSSKKQLNVFKRQIERFESTFR